MATSAHIKASGQRPQGPVGNATGLITPRTEPNLTGGSTKPPLHTESPAEQKSWLERVKQQGGEWVDKAQALLDKGEIKALADAKTNFNALIDRGVEASGYNPLAVVGGALAKAAVTVLAPDNVIDLVPGGKGVTTARKAAKALDNAGDAATAVKKAGDATAGAKAGGKAAENAGDGAKAARGADEPKSAKGGGGGRSDGKGPNDRKKRDPCKHERDAKKRKYVAYMADEFDEHGNLLGKYVGRTSGAPEEPTKDILKRRKSGHHRKGLGALTGLFETDSYAGIRGAEQVLKEKLSTVEQIQPVGDRNARKQDYMDCAESKGVKRGEKE